jgi:hypothetical protein
MFTPSILGRCEPTCVGVTRFAPPQYLFPELPAAYRGDAASALVAKTASAWRVVEIQDSAAAADTKLPLTGDAKSGPSARHVIENLCRSGRLRFDRRGDGKRARVPTSSEVITDLQRLVASYPALDGDEAAKAALLSEHFLHLLAHQRVQQLLDAVPLADDEKHDDGERNAKAHRSEMSIEAERAAGGTYHASADPWDPSKNESSVPSIAGTIVKELTPTTEGVLLAALEALDARFTTLTSQGAQTEILVPGANSTEPYATLPTTVPSSSYHAPILQPPQRDSTSWSLRPRHVAKEPVLLNGNGGLTFGRGVFESPWHVELSQFVAEGTEADAASTLAPLHFVIFGRDGQYTLLNYSRNGVRVNKKWCIAEPIALSPGDVIDMSFGVVEFTVVATGKAPAETE